MSRTILTATGRAVRLSVALAALAGGVVRGDEAAPAADIKAVEAEFEAVTETMKKLVGEMAVLQAKYAQPKTDKKAIEAKFEELKAEAQGVGQKLEDSAFSLITLNPKHKQARDICGAVVAGALQSDDPTKALEKAERIEAAGASDGNIQMAAAASALALSRLDEATDWLRRASESGVPAQVTEELTAQIEHDRTKVAAEMKRREADAAADDLPRVKISTSAGDVIVELFENEAPNTVANFISLVEKGFYDGTPFHRVIGGFMAQGGDPTGSGSGGPGYAIVCECRKPEARKHFLGTLSMAHAGQDTGGSQFFLTFRPTGHLDGKHTVFGRVIEGFDVLPRIARTEYQGQTVDGVVPDTIVKAEVLRKRDHAYEPKTLPDPRK